MEVQSNSSVIGKVSLSFQEELTSTLQNALGVAVEIAVVEITKLLDRALRDVQEKIQEAMQDNNALKSKLQTAETQLSTVRERLDQQPQGLEHFLTGGTKNLPISCRVQGGHRQFKPVEHSSPRHETEVTVDPVHNYDVCGRKGTNVDFSLRESAHDMTHGGAGVQTLNFNTQEEYTQHKLDETNDIKNDQHSISKNDPKMACAGTVTNVQSDGSFFEVAVKKEEGYDDTITVSVVGGEEPNSDSLSLAQSRLLEDWRPQPLYSEDCQLNQPFQSISQLPGQDFVLSSASGQHTNFPKLHRNSESNRYPSKQSRHHCSLCGRNFNRKQHLKIHQRIHTGERPYACSVCSARFRHALTLKRHFRIHTGEKPYACRQCGKTFRNGDGLRFHQCSITTTV